MTVELLQQDVTDDCFISRVSVCVLLNVLRWISRDRWSCVTMTHTHTHSHTHTHTHTPVCRLQQDGLSADPHTHIRMCQ